MKLTELKTRLRARPESLVRVLLPGGGRVPDHFHVTEVGYVAKKFVDCGGTFRASDTCVLQAHVGSDRDDGHRLTAGRLAQILDLASPILPAGDLPVEIEYEGEILSQFPLQEVVFTDATLALRLGAKHTDCLAREKCGTGERAGAPATIEAPCCSGAGAGGCCGS